mgnify:CR=1 FL=1
MKPTSLAHEACAGLAMNYEYEKVYSNCSHSSEFIQKDDLPRTCSLGLFNSKPVWRDCSKCQQLDLHHSNSEELWPNSEYTQLMYKSEKLARRDFAEKMQEKKEEKSKSDQNEGLKKGCSKCQAAKKPIKSRGLGDTIAKITHRLGIKQCKSCKQRQKMLNKRFGYGKDR